MGERGFHGDGLMHQYRRDALALILRKPGHEWAALLGIDFLLSEDEDCSITAARVWVWHEDEDTPSFEADYCVPISRFEENSWGAFVWGQVTREDVVTLNFDRSQAGDGLWLVDGTLGGFAEYTGRWTPDDDDADYTLLYQLLTGPDGSPYPKADRIDYAQMLSRVVCLDGAPVAIRFTLKGDLFPYWDGRD